MYSRKPIIFLISFFFGAAAIAQSAGNPENQPTTLMELQPGVVVEKVEKNSEAERAGLREGDVVLQWTRADSKGAIDSPFVLTAIEIEQGPRGAVTLDGRRGAEKRSWTLGADGWGIQVRPEFQKGILSLYYQGKVLARAGKLTEALDFWQKASVEARKSPPKWLAVWLLLHAADSLSAARRWTDAGSAYRAAMQKAKEAGPPVAAPEL